MLPPTPDGEARVRLELPHVTLVAIDGTPNPVATEQSLALSSSLVKFGKVILFSAVMPELHPESCELFEWVAISPTTLKGYNQFCLSQLHKYMRTSHCLTVQGDSHIVNPEAWTDRWLEYDYIGAPWPPGHSGTEYRVGNSGFCLRSKRLLEATSALPNDTFVWRGTLKRTCRDDVITCVTYRRELEGLGLRFAPVDVAARFSFESSTPEAPALNGQFGVHEHRKRRRQDARLAVARHDDLSVF